MIDVILTNLTKMLTERKFLSSDKLKENINKLLKQKNEERIFKIKSDFSNDEAFIMIIHSKVSSSKKIQGIEQFVAMAGDSKKIFIGNNITQKAYKQFVEGYQNSEVFKYTELLINVIDHDLQPKFELLDKNEREQMLKEYNLTKSNMPIMLKTDPIARYYAANVGDIFRILSPSSYSGEGTRYRYVRDAPISNLYSK